MPEDEGNAEYFFRPSRMPDDHRYEEAQKAVGFRPSIPPRESRSGEEELQKGYKEARLAAKIEVVRLTPGILADYRNRLRDEIRLRPVYGFGIFCLVILWLLCVVYFIEAVGRGDLELESSVLVALTTGVTVSIVGLLGSVITYYFTKSQEQIAFYKQLFETMIDKE